MCSAILWTTSSSEVIITFWKEKEILLKKSGQIQRCKLFSKHLIKQQLHSFCQHMCLTGFCTLYSTPTVKPTKCDTSQVWHRLWTFFEHGSHCVAETDWNLLCSSGCPQTSSVPISQVPGLWACDNILNFMETVSRNVFFLVTFLAMCLEVPWNVSSLA